MPLIKSASREAISTNIREMQNAGHPHKQAVAAALHTADMARRAGGGLAPISPPYFQRSAMRDMQMDAYHHSGLFKSDVAGRTDRLARAVPADSFVFPADVVSGLGQGNTPAGGKLLDAMLAGAPYGARLPRARRADGGNAPDSGLSHVMVAGGEYLVSRDQLMAVGAKLRRAGKSRARSDLAAGHQWARDLVEKVRKQTMKFLKHAPDPKK